MTELPWRCSKCHHEQMVDFDKLESWPLDKLTTARGFVCEGCASREAVSYQTTSLLEAFDHLNSMRTTHHKFLYYFAKAVRKAEGINKRGKDGARGHLHLASPG